MGDELISDKGWWKSSYLFDRHKLFTIHRTYVRFVVEPYRNGREETASIYLQKYIISDKIFVDEKLSPG
ncbi:hypothetical protein BLD50_16255 [Bacillus cereus]|nr:hypothetical protein BLD50_16255 [Bacillus cereus]